MLSSKKEKKKTHALEILSKLPKQSRKLEKEIFNCLLNSNNQRKIIEYAIQSLVNHRVTDRKIIDLVFKHSLDRKFNYEEVIEKLGFLATPSVVRIAVDDRHPAQYTGIRMLGSLSKKDAVAAKALRKIADTHKSSSIRKEAKKELKKAN